MTTMQDTFITLKNDIDSLDIANQGIKQKDAEIESFMRAMDEGIVNKNIAHIKKTKDSITKLFIQRATLEKSRHEFVDFLLTSNCNVDIALISKPEEKKKDAKQNKE